MSDYKCSCCGSAAYYDGRCGDGPVLLCKCDQGEWIDDGRGGYYTNPKNAQPIKAGNQTHYSGYRTWDNWSREDD